MSESSFAPEVQGQVKAFGLLLARSVRNYFKSKENREKFERWYELRYGKPYTWMSIKK